MKRTSFLAVGLMLSLLGAASADDAAVRAAIEEKLAPEEGAAPQVEVTDGAVRLSGKTRSVWHKTKAIESALSVRGVVSVEDDLEIARGENDAKVAEEVAKAVNRYPHFTIYDDVSMVIEDGHVTLFGRVTMPYKSEEIGERASKVLGVQSLTNEISTLPTNIGDQKLRSSLAYRIYGDSLFREYAFRVNPPIHIVVERGRVVLTGAVRSEVERRKAEIIARSTFGVFSVENRLAVGS